MAAPARHACIQADGTSANFRRYAASTGEMPMTAFLPVTLRFCDNTTMLVASVAEAARALGQQWPDKTSPAYVEAARLVPLAVDGTCCQRIAFEALTKAARQQNIVVAKSKSRAHDWLDAVASP
jgi:hypothetical protein